MTECEIDPEELIAADLELIEASSGLCEEPHNNESPNQSIEQILEALSTAEPNDPPGAAKTITKETKAHFDIMLNRCLCKPKCVSTDMLVMAQSFSSMREDDRSNTVRAMLLALSTPCNKANELMAWDPERAQKSKAKRRKQTATANTTTRYSIKGARLCEYGFAAIVQMHNRSVQKHAAVVAASPNFHVKPSGHHRSHKGHISIQTTTALAFLRRYADVYALPCPTGRGSDNEAPIQWLGSGVRREDIYNHYRERWADIIGAASAGLTVTVPDAPLSQVAFLRVWSNHCPTLRILRAGSDFCDQCTTLLSTANGTMNTDLRRTLLEARERHRQEASIEFKLYKDILCKAQQSPSDRPIHLIFDFVEKVLLPHLLRQPGQLHFVTGLKFDIFGVYSSGQNVCFVYGLPEGHWPNNKTCNEVGSMLHHAISLHRLQGSTTQFHRTMDLHADNCSGQNKNRFMLWYLLWRVCMQYDDEVFLRFLVAGHTKNRCDAAFGMVKRRLKQFDMFGPRQMMRIIEESASTNQVVCSTEVKWFNWKAILGRFFCIPNTMKLSKYHIFRFSSSYLEGVFVKGLSTDGSWTKFRLLKRGVTALEVKEGSIALLNDITLRVEVTPLGLVPSAKEKTRKAYLVKNVLERYYEGNADRQEEYFCSGGDWNSLHT